MAIVLISVIIFIIGIIMLFTEKKNAGIVIDVSICLAIIGYVVYFVQLCHECL